MVNELMSGATVVLPFVVGVIDITALLAGFLGGKMSTPNVNSSVDNNPSCDCMSHDRFDFE